METSEQTPLWLSNLIKDTDITTDLLKVYKESVANFIGIPLDDSWGIYDIDTDSKLVLFHYTFDFPKTYIQTPGRLFKNPVKNIRGLIFDMSIPNAPILVARSQGYISNVVFPERASDLHEDQFVLDTVSITDSHLGKVSEMPILKLQDLDFHLPNRSSLIFNEQYYQIRMAFEGTIIRVFKHNGIIYWSSHRKINARGATWSDSPNFEQIYKECEGPDIETLFDKNKKYSPYCYTFEICHPSLYVSSKIPTTKPFVAFVGWEMMWVPENCPYNPVDVSFEPAKLELVQDTKKIMDFLTGKINKIGLIEPPILYSSDGYSDPEVKWDNVTSEKGTMFVENGLLSRILKDGYNEHNPNVSNTLLNFGEFVNIYKINPNDGRVTDIYKLNSKSYYWRYMNRGGKIDLKNRAFYLTGYATGKLKANYQSYAIKMNYEKISELRKLNSSNINERSKKWALVEGPKNELNNIKNRIYNIFQIFLYGLPWEQQKKTAGIFKDYEDVIMLLKTYFSDTFRNRQHIGNNTKDLYEMFKKSNLDAVEFIDMAILTDPILCLNAANEINNQ